MKKLVIWLCFIWSVIALIFLICWNNNTDAYILTNTGEPMIECSYKLDKEIIEGWYNEDDGIWYFFLPSYMKNLRHVMFEGRKHAIDDVICLDGKQIIIKISSNLTSVYVSTTKKNNELLWADKEYKEAGSIKTVNKQGEIFFKEFEYITGRGNSTWAKEKKPYTVKFKEAIALEGMTPTKKWVLLANAYEGTKVSYKMMLDMAKYIGLEYTPDSQWVDLYLNGEYVGNYLLCQAIDVNSGCIDLKNGILVEKDYPDYYVKEENGFVLDNGLTFSIKAPKIISEDEIKDISQYFSMVDSLIRKGDKSYNYYLELETIAKNYLMDEISYKSDTGITSTFFYKEKEDNILFMGPVWDFDGCFGDTSGKWTDFEGRVLDTKETYRGEFYLDWYNLLYENDEGYYAKVIEIYRSLLPYLEYLVNIGIDEYAAYIGDSVRMDMIRWDYGENRAGYYDMFENNIRYLKFFLSKRINFLSREWESECNINYDVGNGRLHTIELEIDGEIIREKIMDGELIENLPHYEGRKWIYNRDGKEWNQYIPVLENVSLRLE